MVSFQFSGSTLARASLMRDSLARFLQFGHSHSKRQLVDLPHGISTADMRRCYDYENSEALVKDNNHNKYKGKQIDMPRSKVDSLGKGYNNYAEHSIDCFRERCTKHMIETYRLRTYQSNPNTL